MSFEEQLLQFLLGGCGFSLGSFSSRPVLDERGRHNPASLVRGLVLKSCRIIFGVQFDLIAIAPPVLRLYVPDRQCSPAA